MIGTRTLLGASISHLLVGVNFINVLHSAFTLVDPEIVKNTVKSSVFYAFRICGHKSCT